MDERLLGREIEAQALQRVRSQSTCSWRLPTQLVKGHHARPRASRCRD